MIALKNVKNLEGKVVDHTVESVDNSVVDGKGKLMMLPALLDVDAPIGFTVEAPTEAAQWVRATQKYLHAGMTGIFDAAPHPALQLSADLKHCQELLIANNLPLHVYYFCDGDDPEEYDNFGKAKAAAAGIKITIDLASKPIAAPHLSSMDRLFQLAAQENMIVAIELIHALGSANEQREKSYSTLQTTVELAEKYSAELCILHVRTQEEINLIKNAKKNGILIYTQISYQHLFFNAKDFPDGLKFHGRQTFLPSPGDQQALWEGIHDESIDMLGSAGYFTPPALMLPLLFETHENFKLSPAKLVELGRANAEAIFSLKPVQDLVIIDPDTKHSFPHEWIKDYPFLERWKEHQLAGWPTHVVSKGHLIEIKKSARY